MTRRTPLGPPMVLLALAACDGGQDKGPFAHGEAETATTDTGETGETGETGGETSGTGDTALATGACAWSASGLSTATVSGSAANEGFGSALALSPSGLWVGAPDAEGRVYAVSGSTASVKLEGDGRLGAALTPLGTSFVAGAPLADSYAGQIANAVGTVVGGGGGLAGLALASEDDHWIAATASGWVDSDGTTGSEGGHPSAIALRDGAVAVGFAHGEEAVDLDGIAVARPADADEAGYALAVGDRDGDGAADWVVGAPGAATAYVLDSSGAVAETLSGDGGRFGAALAVADVDGDGTDDLLVGAPMSGKEVKGAAYLYLGGDWTTPALTWTGAAAGDQLGFAVAATRCRIAIGAPGAATADGSVTVVSAAESD